MLRGDSCGDSEEDYGSFSINIGKNANGGLVGKGTASLTWFGRELVRVVASGTNWVRYENGIQECWGSGLTKANGSLTVTFPAAFSAPPTVTASVVGTSDKNNTQVNVDTDYYDIRMVCVFWGYVNNALIENCGIYWRAIGNWE